MNDAYGERAERPDRDPYGQRAARERRSDRAWRAARCDTECHLRALDGAATPGTFGDFADLVRGTGDILDFLSNE